MDDRMTYDKSCYELAKSFIDDVLPVPMQRHENYHELAKRIQREIQDFLIEKEVGP